MAREIRVSIDDDEVFERMKRRKHELDLSWEEVLHRGLRRAPPGEPAEPEAPWGPEGSHSGDHAGARTDEDRDAGGRRRGGGRGRGSGRGDGSGPGPGWRRDQGRGGRGDESHGRGPRREDPWDAFAENLEEQIRGRVFNSLESTFGAAGLDVGAPGDLDAEMASLASAEDAALVFPFLPDECAYEVPLRVDMRTGPNGITIEVVAVRQGKGVRDANRFDTDARKRVNTRLAAGDAAELRFADGAEAYRVRPALSWTRGEEGHPTVDEVEITEVVLDADE